MTICVAAMAQVPNYPTIVAATDRAITTGNQVYDGATQAKRHILTPQIIALGAGDVLDEAEIVARARREIEQHQLQSVSEVAECFAKNYRAYRQQVYEREFLEPHGLTWDTYNALAQGLPQELVDSVERGIRERWLSVSEREFGSSTIIAGVDRVSNPSIENYITAHIYVIKDPGQVLCADSIGFAAIGEGLLQAESYLMLEKYSADIQFNDATLLIYSAKRNSERAPHVGAETNLMRIDITGMGNASDADLEGIEEIYQRDLKRKRASVTKARVQMTKFMEGLNAKQLPVPEPQAPPAILGEGTTNGESASQEA